WAAPSQSGLPLTAGVVRFAHHHIAMIALDAPVKQEVLARTVAVSPMPDELRTDLMAHSAAIRLLYVGEDAEPANQLTALYAVAAALLSYGGLGILNERATLAQPAELAASYLAQLGAQPPPLPLWVGVVTFLQDDLGPSQRYLMRTYGMEQFGLPELAMHFGDQSHADATYHTLLNVGLYLIESGTRLNIGPGHTAEFKGHT